MSDVVRVKREGGRGHHLIERSKYDADPKAFVLADADGKPMKAEHAVQSASPAATPPAATAVDPVLGDLRKQYRAKFGKGAGPKWTAEQISEKLAVE